MPRTSSEEPSTVLGQSFKLPQTLKDPKSPRVPKEIMGRTACEVVVGSATSTITYFAVRGYRWNIKSEYSEEIIRARTYSEWDRRVRQQHSIRCLGGFVTK